MNRGRFLKAIFAGTAGVAAPSAAAVAMLSKDPGPEFEEPIENANGMASSLLVQSQGGADPLILGGTHGGTLRFRQAKDGDWYLVTDVAKPMRIAG